MLAITQFLLPSCVSVRAYATLDSSILNTQLAHLTLTFPDDDDTLTVVSELEPKQSKAKSKSSTAGTEACSYRVVLRELPLFLFSAHYLSL